MTQKDYSNSVNTYLNQISKNSLLAQEQETHLFKKIEDSETELKRLLCRRETKKLSQKIYHLKRKIKKYKDKVINANLRLVVWVVKNYSHPHLSFLDLIQEGNLGLMEAVNRFKYKKGFKFSTYATYWIRKYIKKRIAEEPIFWGLDDIAGEGIDLADVLPDRKTPSPEDALLKILNTGEMIQVLSTILSEQEKTIIELRYDVFRTGKKWNLEEVGQLYDITPGRVSQIETTAKNKIKETVKGWQK